MLPIHLCYVDFRSELMHMLCSIMYKVRSENGYGFLRPVLKTGVGNGTFWSEIWSGFREAGAHPHPPKIPRSKPPGLVLGSNIPNKKDSVSLGY